ncbi:hypothetical protein M5X00_13090 [Paenibacillus alvei]|uniref:hypothetical protein n=1 Tax=Paenibacillus alvei TaxID=44250 RepID=UPI000288BCB1|nr:hypothetical protein [Paenibacillus alvei]EJW13813.1 hypothetical protein PAV_109p00430 [Paenibacillus alvei DSM 29]MCY9540539.1 hypothetical protein [Paenibacillus alvei]MCY9708256.1 hypothetical protein [Paenibacillus alvei]MCY9732947.1 hypothetical protein [Paenibacillus alvei]MCY9755176.1 hypothetical protein [Paenibacillus alvei]
MESLKEFFKDLHIILEKASEEDDPSKVNDTAQLLLLFEMTMREECSWNQVKQKHGDLLTDLHNEAILIEYERELQFASGQS